MKQLISRVAVLLMGLTTALSLGLPAYALPDHQPIKPAGCHGHKAPTPVPARESNQCCATGHNVAIPAASFVVQPLITFLGTTAETQPMLGTDLSAVGTVLANPFLCDGSPGIVPLRI